MNRSSVIRVDSEIGRLRRVLLHRPGRELENLTPDNKDRLLFDDIPDLELAREEHDAFAKILQDNGAEVLYLEDLVAKVLEGKDLRSQFLDEFIAEGNVYSKQAQALKEYFMSFTDSRKLVDQLIAGLRKEEFQFSNPAGILGYVDDSEYLILDPLPNLYFTRDPFATIRSGVSIHKMYAHTRARETLFAKYIFSHHPDFMENVPQFYSRDESSHIEGGDILILSEDVLAIGISQRTQARAIEVMAKNLFQAENAPKHVLAFKIPEKRAFMHLDTVFTMIDKDVFTIHPAVEGPLVIYDITWDGSLKIERKEEGLEEVLMEYLHLDQVKIIRCGGRLGIDADREQWNDGSNTLAIAPGEVVVYSRNRVTNRLLEEAGVKLHVMPSSELSRGRGGPRCMSMPLNRESVI